MILVQLLLILLHQGVAGGTEVVLTVLQEELVVHHQLCVTFPKMHTYILAPKAYDIY